MGHRGWATVHGGVRRPGPVRESLPGPRCRDEAQRPRHERPLQVHRASSSPTRRAARSRVIVGDPPTDPAPSHGWRGCCRQLCGRRCRGPARLVRPRATGASVEHLNKSIPEVAPARHAAFPCRAFRFTHDVDMQGANPCPDNGLPDVVILSGARTPMAEWDRRQAWRRAERRCARERVRDRARRGRFARGARPRGPLAEPRGPRRDGQRAPDVRRRDLRRAPRRRSRPASPTSARRSP
jgi:hypothetical protein